MQKERKKEGKLKRKWSQRVKRGKKLREEKIKK